MKIYTSYFSNIKNIPSHIWPLSVARYRPAWYPGAELSVVAPSPQLLGQLQAARITWADFETLYRAELDSLDSKVILQTIKDKVWDNDVCLLCYEPPGVNCHRHILAEWLSEATGQAIVEYTGGDRI